MAPELLQTLQGPAGEKIVSVKWSPDGSRLAIATGARIQVCDVASGAPAARYLTIDSLGLAWSPDGEFLAAGDYNGTSGAIVLWDPESGGEPRRLTDTVTDGRELVSVDWARASNMLAVSRGSGSIELWDPVDGSFVGHLQKTPLRITFEVAFAPDGTLLASAEQDAEIRIWNVTQKRSYRVLKDSGEVHTVAWSPDGRLLASGNSENTVLLWNPHEGTELIRLEGHTGAVHCVRFSKDGRLLASSSADGTVRIWGLDVSAAVAVIDSMHGGDSLGQPIDFHPSAPRLAAVNGEQTGVCIWQVDPELLATPVGEAIRYTTARIVLVGDSGVGKTGLGWRLAREEFKEHSSTHGQQFWSLNQLETTRGDGVQCEAILWDLAGQPDYRLVHSLFLDTVDLALLLFDPTNRHEPLAGVDYWLRHLQAASSQPPRIILVGARTDRGSPTLTPAELITFCERHGIAGGYLGTSAKEGDGLDDLMARIKGLIPWEAMSATVTTATFKHVRDHVLALKEHSDSGGVLVSTARLRQNLERADPGRHFTDAEMSTAVRHLETHGYVKRLRSTAGDDYVLLAPELISKLASSIVLEARREAHGLGALDEERLLKGDYRLPELDGLEHDERRIVLDAVVLLFLEHNVCFREYLGSRVLLIFPSLINEQRPLVSDSPIIEDVSYTLSGAVENVYAALVVLLGYTNTFTRTHQWQNQAQYELEDGEICGFRQVDQGKGVAEVILYYGTATPDRVKLLFQGLFETFLIRRDLSITRYLPVACPACGERQDRTVVLKQIDRGRRSIFCADCGLEIDIPSPEDLTVKGIASEEVRDQQQVADHRTTFEAGLVKVKSLMLELGDAEARPTCFISYARGLPEHERWVLQLAKDLRNADVDVLLDRWHSPPGSDLGRYIDRILGCNFVIVAGTPGLRQKYEANSADPVVAAELELIALRLRQPHQYGRTVVPILLQGTESEAFPPQLQKLVHLDFRNSDAYFPQLFTLIWQLCSLPFDHPLLEELQASIGEMLP